jgi:hypothetical protein
MSDNPDKYRDTMSGLNQFLRQISKSRQKSRHCVGIISPILILSYLPKSHHSEYKSLKVKDLLFCFILQFAQMERIDISGKTRQKLRQMARFFESGRPEGLISDEIHRSPTRIRHQRRTQGVRVMNYE